jgi:hypothetical protein
MRIIIEYCRSQRVDSALAVVDRLFCDTISLAAAKSIAVVLAGSGMLPRGPDLVRVLDVEGNEFFSAKIKSPCELIAFPPLVVAGGDLET